MLLMRRGAAPAVMTHISAADTLIVWALLNVSDGNVAITMKIKNEMHDHRCSLGEILL